MKKLLLTIFFIGIYQWAIAQEGQSMIYTHVDQMPYFPGCDEFNDGSEEKRTCSNEALVSFISNHLQYPQAAKEEGVQGTALITFIIDETGTITESSILRDIGSDCGQAALNVIRKMPAWEAGLQEGKRVKVKLNLPIQFNLKSKNPDTDQYKLSWGRLRARKVSKKELLDNIEFDVLVRDPYGNPTTVSELVFSTSKKRAYHERKSTGKITADMTRLIKKKVKKGGTFTITAAIQQKGKFTYARRTYEIVN